MDRIVQYLREKYRPRALLVYGSYVRGDQDGFSDFDCMVIVDSKEKNHDDSVVDGVQLDCYIFTADEVSGEDVDPYITAYDSRIVFDDGIGASLKGRVRKYVAEHTVTEESEKEFIAELPEGRFLWLPAMVAGGTVPPATGCGCRRDVVAGGTVRDH